MPRKQNQPEQAQAPPGTESGRSSFETKLRSYIKAGYPAIYIVSQEEQRVHLIFSELAKDLEFSLYSWSYTKGLRNVTDDPPTEIAETADPLAVLDAAVKLPEKSIVLLNDYHQFLADANPMLTRSFKDALAIGKMSNRVLVVIGCQLKIPPELEKSIVVVEFALPSRDQLNVVLEGIANSAGIHLDGNRDAILDAASGCTCQEAEDAFALSVVQCGDIKADVVAAEKAQTIRKNGLLEIVETAMTLEDIGGLDLYKEHLWSIRNCFSKAAREYGLPSPRPIICCGNPGTGKSLSAMACKNVFNLPLLRLEAGRLFGSLVGASEANWRTAFSTAKAVAPAILMIDEAEALFSGGQSSGSTDGGTTNRVIKAILQDMQFSGEGLLFLFTSNDIDQFPDPLIDRCDVWSFDLPTAKERQSIWKIHVAKDRTASKRNRKPDAFDIPRLAELTEGYSGRQIEQVWCKALTTSFNDGGREPTDADVENALRFFVPTSVTMKDAIERRRARLKNRARPASAIENLIADGKRKLA